MKKLREVYENMDWLEKRLVHKLLGVLVFTTIALVWGGLCYLFNIIID